jgi:hypothetical protein
MEHDSRTLEVAVRKVLLEDWNFCRAPKSYKASWLTLKESIVKASENCDVRYNFEDVRNWRN